MCHGAHVGIRGQHEVVGSLLQSCRPWELGLELGFSGLSASTLTTEPSCWPSVLVL